jgi:hypothetical protein
MIFMAWATGVALVLVLALAAFSRVDAARLADGIRLAGPVALGLAGIAMLFTGRAAFAGILIPAALGWYMRGRARRAATPTPGLTSSVRTAALEMELDHDTGRLEGVVLAGRFEGRALAGLDQDQLVALHGELASDGESLQLLEAYLDGRFPVWRDHAQPNADGGKGGAPASGPMSKEEAYKVLGLEAGASTADIRKAHRRLMQRVHPDLGGSTFLAARINEAKDVLLSEHN